MNSIDIELIIFEIETRKNIQNSADKNHQNQNFRLKAWEDITKIIMNVFAIYILFRT